MNAKPNSEITESKIKVFYDGLCVVCSAEINHYKKMKGHEKIAFIDITGPEFNAVQENLDPVKIHKHLHAKDADGKVYIGVDTFILIWSHLPKLNWLARLAEKSFAKKVLEFNYALFVRIRPYLPRRSCEQSPYCEIKP